MVRWQTAPGDLEGRLERREGSRGLDTPGHRPLYGQGKGAGGVSLKAVGAGALAMLPPIFRLYG